MGIGMALTGCAGLPENVDRPVNRALADPSSTALASMVQDKSAAKARHPSGFVLLSGAQAAYSSRLALVESAQKTLDLQYYAIHADVSTQRLLQSVVAAAERGVRVRVLLDDLHSTGRDAQVMRLAFVPNVEMRMFNPLTGARNSQLGRIFSLVGDFSRVQQRMHNKLFIADNALGIAGGRNLGNAYFGNDDAGNLWTWMCWRPPWCKSCPKRLMPTGTTHGPTRAVADLTPSAAGDASQRAQGRPRGWGQRRHTCRGAALQPHRSRAKNDTRAASPHLEPGAHGPEGCAGPGPRRRAGWIHPRKFRRRRRATQARTAPPRCQPPRTRQNWPHRPAAGHGGGRLAAADGQAKKDLLIVSPYFVPGPDMKQAFAAARAWGARAGADELSGVQRRAHRTRGVCAPPPELLATGLELYEMRSELSGLRSVFQGTGSSGVTGSSGDSKSHAAFQAIDPGRAPAGHRFDESGLALATAKYRDCPAHPQPQLVGTRHRANHRSRLEDAAWRVEQDSEGRLVWLAPKDSGLKDATAEPDTSAPCAGWCAFWAGLRQTTCCKRERLFSPGLAAAGSNPAGDFALVRQRAHMFKRQLGLRVAGAAG